MLAIFNSENFPHSKAVANNSTRKFQERKIRDGPISAEWDMDDHMVALKSRMSPLRAVGIGLLSVAIRVYRVFWPES